VTEWVPISSLGTIWRAGDAMVWRRCRVAGGPWSGLRAELGTFPRHGFESAQDAARYALETDEPKGALCNLVEVFGDP
jgi:hypothetical protein